MLILILEPRGLVLRACQTMNVMLVVETACCLRVRSPEAREECDNRHKRGNLNPKPYCFQNPGRNPNTFWEGTANAW